MAKTTSKKNTLLYLDNRLVKKAKDAGLNLSKITEKAIKSSLNVDSLIFDPKPYLEELIDNDSAFFIPFRLEGIEINDIEPIKNLKINLSEFNIITGRNASGKTTIINTIRNAVINTGDFRESGKIQIRIKKIRSIDVNFKKNTILQSYKCILLDEAFGRLNREAAIEFLNYLKTLKMQIIITCLDINHINSNGNLDNVNIIRLTEPEHDIHKKELMAEIACLNDELVRISATIKSKKNSKAHKDEIKHMEMLRCKLETQIAHLDDIQRHKNYN
jgi:hypothetical protein